MGKELKSSDNTNRICKGICKKFTVKKPTLGNRYGSGQGHCQTCDVWINHKGCHAIDGSDAKENSVGWFCNCCNMRVRQKPRNGKYKEKPNYIAELEDEVTAENLDISKKQAMLLKEISSDLPNKDEDLDILKITNNVKDHVGFEIKDNWGSWEKFFEFATNYNKLNQISAIIIFEKLNTSIERVATMDEFLDKVHVDEEWINNKFKSWGHLLELLGHDPWYRSSSKKEVNSRSKRNVDSDIVEKTVIEKVKDESIEEMSRKINELKIRLLAHYKLKDAEKMPIDYSYVEMFELLEKYIKIIPNAQKYLDLKSYFQS
jgi:hypothetical protein